MSKPLFERYRPQTWSEVIVRLFKPQFAELVRSGVKSTTIRPTPKRPLKIGDALSLRRWTGLPYRSKQEILRESVVTEVHSFSIGTLVYLDHVALEPKQAEELAKGDGFGSVDELRDWFKQQHGLPFTGVLIRWKV